jgi:enamine deaminase RidA (YjgF/YER057c/UK114 family)
MAGEALAVVEWAMSEIINPPELGQPAGFSHAVRSGATIYLAGQTGKGETLPEQFEDALGRLLTALKAAGGEPDDLVSVQVFVTDVPAYKTALGELGQIWQRHCGRRYPAMGLFGVRELFEAEAVVELMGVACVEQ